MKELKEAKQILEEMKRILAEPDEVEENDFCHCGNDYTRAMFKQMMYKYCPNCGGKVIYEKDTR